MRDIEGLDTVGRREFVEWLARPGNSQSAVARSLELNQSSVSLWVRGRSRPEPHVREALALLTGIDPTAWDTADERALVERVRATSKRTATRRRASGTTTRPPRTGTEG